jgi:hypothetical protein
MTSLIRFAINRIQPITEVLERLFHGAGGRPNELKEKLRLTQFVTKHINTAKIWKEAGKSGNSPTSTIGGFITYNFGSSRFVFDSNSLIPKAKRNMARMMVSETLQSGRLPEADREAISKHIINFKNTPINQQAATLPSGVVNYKPAQDWTETQITNFELEFGKIPPIERSRLEGQFIRHYKNPTPQNEKIIIDTLERLHKGVYARLPKRQEKKLIKLIQDTIFESHHVHTDDTSYREAFLSVLVSYKKIVKDKKKVLTAIKPFLKNDDPVTEQQIKPIVDQLIRNNAIKPLPGLEEIIKNHINGSKISSGFSERWGVNYIQKNINNNRFMHSIEHEIGHRGPTEYSNWQLMWIGGTVDRHLYNKFSANVMELLNERFTVNLGKRTHFFEKSTALIQKGRSVYDTTFADLGYQNLHPLIKEFNEFLDSKDKRKEFDRWYLEFKTLSKKPPKEFYTLLKEFQNQHDILK